MAKIWTIGHSNRTSSEFIELLKQAGVQFLVDVRRFAGSRRQPQFQQEALRQALSEAGIGYRHLESLGGRRTRRDPQSPNFAWRVESFNAYADHMQTDEFLAGLAELEELARTHPTVIMCSEAVPWRCHRRLIADALLVRGWTVLDILSAGQTKPHSLTEFARVDGTRVTYPGLLGSTE